MKKLSYNVLEEIGYEGYVLKDAPERVLQFGEGNFLRGFADYFFDILNEKGLFNGKIVAVQPIEQGMGAKLNEQEGLYTLYLRGLNDGQRTSSKRIVSAISRVINPFEDDRIFLDCAANPELRFIISNTTEAGIAFDGNDRQGDIRGTFPAKLANFLWERYKIFGNEKGKGFIILSCELIDDNGAVLKNYVTKYHELWNLPKEFVQWVEAENIFCGTLVDRIVTGYPRSEIETLTKENGYIDEVIDTGEPFAFWAIEGPDWLRRELPFEEAGLPVRIVSDQSSYKKRKVRILNGAQTATTLPAYLSGLEYERAYMEDALFLKYISGIMFDEIIPATDLPADDMKRFADSCLERLANPYIDHRLYDISLNSVPKWRSRILPTLKDYYDKFNKLPKYLTFSLAALLAFYSCSRQEDGTFLGMYGSQPYAVNDDFNTLEFFAEKSKLSTPEYVREYLQNTGMHGADFSLLPGFEEKVTGYLDSVRNRGMLETVADLVNGE